jgi:hypothetical protein
MSASEQHRVLLRFGLFETSILNFRRRNKCFRKREDCGAGEHRTDGRKVAAVPNPYRGDIAYVVQPPWERPQGNRPGGWSRTGVQFVNLPASCQIKIYTLAGT